jgi:hypothetical protein
MMRITMKPDSPLELESQDVADRGLRAKVWDTVYSIDYAAPKGVEYGLLQGQLGNFSSVGTYTALTSRVSPDGGIVFQHEIIRPAKERNAFLLNALRNSAARGIGKETYSTTGNNCTTSLFCVMDDTFKYKREVSPFKIHPIWNFSDPVSGPSIAALRERGIIDPDAILPPANEELEAIQERQAEAVYEVEEMPKANIPCQKHYAGLPQK